MVKRAAPKLVHSISRAVSLCESTLAFGKAEEPPPRLDRIALAPIVSDVLESEMMAAEGTEIALKADVPPGMVLRADPEQLHRVLANLVRNARQAIVNTGQPGEIAVSAHETDDTWILRVSDTGPGLPAKARDHLFQPFQGGATKGGSGLGLTIAAELIRGHGGTVTLEASDEAGTTFRIDLPRGGVEKA